MATEHLPDDECFQNLRNLSSSPLNNQDPEYTRILTPAETRSLLAAGFSQGMDAAVEAEFLTRTGRHPYA